MWNGIYNTAKTPRAWRLDAKGEDIGKQKYFGDEVQRKALWEHTMEVMRGALANN